MSALDDYVYRLVELQAQREEIDQQIEAVKDQIANEHGIGSTTFNNGVKISVREPNRRFDLDAALSALTPEQIEVCRTVNVTKVKAQLPPAVAETFYKPGVGKLVVQVS